MTNPHVETSVGAAAANNKNQIHLVVVTLSGNFEDDFNIHQQLSHVVDKALKALNIKPPPGEEWILSYEGTALNLSRTIESYNLPDGAVLQLAAKEGGGGWSWMPK